MATFFEGIDLRQCRFPLKPSGDVKWAYTSPYGMRLLNGQWGFHNGDDIGSSHYPHFESPYGWQLPAIMDGDVYYRYDSRSGYNANLETNHGTFTYCHMIDSMSNRSVKAGEPVGLCGTSGNVAAHLHFIWFVNNGTRNPRPLLDAIASAQWSEHSPTPNPPIQKDDEMVYLMMNENTGHQFVVSGIEKRWLKDETLPVQEIIDGLKAGGAIDLRDQPRAAYLEGLEVIGDEPF